MMKNLSKDVSNHISILKWEHSSNSGTNGNDHLHFPHETASPMQWWTCTFTTNWYAVMQRSHFVLIRRQLYKINKTKVTILIQCFPHLYIRKYEHGLTQQSVELPKQSIEHIGRSCIWNSDQHHHQEDSVGLTIHTWDGEAIQIQVEIQ